MENPGKKVTFSTYTTALSPSKCRITQKLRNSSEHDHKTKKLSIWQYVENMILAALILLESKNSGGSMGENQNYE